MWEHVVGDYSSEYKQLSGSIGQQEGAGRVWLAVVDYNIVFPSARTYQFVVPLDSDGYAAYPFGYRGRERTPIRIWDKTNVNEAGTPPEVGKGYGSALSDGFLKLWGLPAAS